ncbi:hypothetical protein Q8A67_021905 [Cirrhinus molitorella]|uniref:Uncharacterized protein n=1 Tax=Cirrhinus molitorella TaxID=172907 RepID=A0AA88TGH0_9TELE|nr:hypothetical protein Q8A67_021905 [Cirrhinus molitorella]
MRQEVSGRERGGAIVTSDLRWSSRCDPRTAARPAGAPRDQALRDGLQDSSCPPVGSLIMKAVVQYCALVLLAEVALLRDSESLLKVMESRTVGESRSQMLSGSCGWAFPPDDGRVRRSHEEELE